MFEPHNNFALKALKNQIKNGISIQANPGAQSEVLKNTKTEEVCQLIQNKIKQNQ